MRRLPLNNIKMNVAGIAQLIQNEELKDEFIQKIDQPLEIEIDTDSGREFLKCEYNRDGDSYRSPFSNKYFPKENQPEDPIFPS